MSYVVGLTGGIGSGKTLVSDAFAKLGVNVIDADVIAREVVAPGSFGLQQIVDKFGVEILNKQGELNRALLRERVFQDPTLTTWLNAQLHPLIRNKMLAELAQSHSSYTILAVPLLFENQLDSMCNSTVVVDVDETTQLTRAMDRDGVDLNNIKRIMAQQMPRKQRCERADFVIDNNGTPDETVETVKKLHHFYINAVK
jgi:dephospho-CoA kinase